MKDFLYIFGKKAADGNRKMWRCERKDYICRARKLRRYRLCDERIQRIVQNYANYGIIDYICVGLAHNFEMNRVAKTWFL